MLDWRGDEVEAAKSAGGVLALANVWENVIRPIGVPWPPPELIQKVYQSRQVRAFRASNSTIATKALGFYSDLQSLHSGGCDHVEPFRVVAYATPETRVNFVRALLGLIDIPSESISIANVWLWRRSSPHPRYARVWWSGDRFRYSN